MKFLLPLLCLLPWLCLGQFTAGINRNSSFGVAGFLDGYRLILTNYDSGVLGTGSSTIITAPASHYVWLGQPQLRTTNTSSSTWAQWMVISGNIFRFSTSASGTTNTITASGVANTVLLHPGDSFISSNATAGTRIVIPACLVPTNFTRLVRVSFTNFTGGDDVVYTTPAGFMAISPNNLLGNTLTSMSLSNDSGATLAPVVMHVIRSGDSIGVGTLWYQQVSTGVGNGSVGSLSVPQLFPGDSITLNTGSAAAGQCLFSILLEAPYP